MIKNNFRILKKPHANLQTIAKAPVKFQKDWPKTVGGVEGTRYLLKIRNHAPRKAENSVPPLFFEKAGDNKTNAFKSVGLRIQPLLTSAKINPNTIEEHSVPEIPSWCIRKPSVVFSLYSGKKSETNNSELCEHRTYHVI